MDLLNVTTAFIENTILLSSDTSRERCKMTSLCPTCIFVIKILFIKIIVYFFSGFFAVVSFISTEFACNKSEQN